MKKILVSVFVLFICFFGTELFSQSTSPDADQQVLRGMVDEVADMLIDELGDEDTTVDIFVQGISMQNVPLVLGEYLAASLPIQMSRRLEHSIVIRDRPGLGYYGILGQVFRIGEGLKLFISVQDQEGKVLAGKELHLPLSSDLEELLVPSNNGGGSADLYEPDSSARPMVLNPENGRVERELDSADRDWFAFSLPENASPSVLTVQTAGSLDTYLEVYKNGNFSDPIAENDDFDDGNAKVSVDIAPGETVVASVRGYDNSETGSYSLITQVQEFIPDSSEPNNRMEDAVLLEIGGEKSFQIYPSGDEDWYTLQIPPSRDDAYLNIETGGSLDTYMELYNEQGTLLVSDDDGSGDIQARIAYGPIQGGETFFVKVRHYDTGTGDYTLVMDFFTPEFDDFEPDNTWEEASELNISESGNPMIRNYLFSYPEDSDWVVFTIQESRTLTLSTQGSADTILTLYDENHQVLQESDDDGEDYNGRIEYTFPPGTYRLETKQYPEDPRVGIEYQLMITAE